MTSNATIPRFPGRVVGVIDLKKVREWGGAGATSYVPRGMRRIRLFRTLRAWRSYEHHERLRASATGGTEGQITVLPLPYWSTVRFQRDWIEGNLTRQTVCARPVRPSESTR